MIIKHNEIVNHQDVEVGRIIKLELKIANDTIIIPRAEINSISTEVIDITPLLDNTSRENNWQLIHSA